MFHLVPQQSKSQIRPLFRLINTPLKQPPITSLRPPLLPSLLRSLFNLPLLGPFKRIFVSATLVLISSSPTSSLKILLSTSHVITSPSLTTPNTDRETTASGEMCSTIVPLAVPNILLSDRRNTYPPRLAASTSMAAESSQLRACLGCLWANALQHQDRVSRDGEMRVVDAQCEISAVLGDDCGVGVPQHLRGGRFEDRA
jgi:hypothetical protein